MKPSWWAAQSWEACVAEEDMKNWLVPSLATKTIHFPALVFLLDSLDWYPPYSQKGYYKVIYLLSPLFWSPFKIKLTDLRIKQLQPHCERQVITSISTMKTKLSISK